MLRDGGVVFQTGGRDLMAMRVGTDSVPQPLIASARYDESAIALSSDGEWSAYESMGSAS